MRSLIASLFAGWLLISVASHNDWPIPDSAYAQDIRLIRRRAPATGGGGGTITIDSQMPSAAGVAVVADGATFSFTNTAGTLLICGAEGHLPGITSMTMTYNGVSMTEVSSYVQWDGTNGIAHIFYLASPATGANNVAVNAGTANTIQAGCLSVTGANLTTPVVSGNVYTANDNVGSPTASVTATSTTAGNLVVSLVGTAGGVSSTSNTMSWVLNRNYNTGSNNGAMAYATSTGGSVGMSYTVVNDVWGIVAAEIAAQ